MMPEISIIIPAYNVEGYLSDCLESVLRQSFSDFELIVLDDGSSDGTGSLCDEFACRDKRVRVVHSKNEGAARARNRGIDLARGRYVWFVDADDWVAEDALSCLYDEARRTGADCVLFDSIRCYPDGREVRSPLFSERFTTSDPVIINEIQRYFLYPPCSRFYSRKTTTGFVAPWSKFIRLSLVKENQVRFDEGLMCLYEDGMFTLRLFDFVKSVSYLPESLYRYRFLENSLIHAYGKELLEKRERAFHSIEVWLSETTKGADYWSAYYGHVISHLGGLLSRYFFHAENKGDRASVDDELRQVTRREPYATAVRAADRSLLKKKDRALAFCGRRSSVFGFKLYYLAKRMRG